MEAGGEITDGDFEAGDVGELSPKDAGNCGFSLSAIFWLACCLSFISSRAATLASLNFSTNWSKENNYGILGMVKYCILESCKVIPLTRMRSSSEVKPNP